MPTTTKQASVALDKIIEAPRKDTMSIAEVINHLGHRSLCMSILLFSLPNAIPLGVPGFSTVTGIPMALISLQMAYGRKTLWLPQKIADKRFSPRPLKKVLLWFRPAVKWLEQFMHTRWKIVTSPMGERMIGVVFFILAVIIALPLPGSNFLPALAMSLLAIGMLARDGVFVCGAVAFAIAGLVFIYWVTMFIVGSSLPWIERIF
jgi:hypothetical protein